MHSNIINDNIDDLEKKILTYIKLNLMRVDLRQLLISSFKWDIGHNAIVENIHVTREPSWLLFPKCENLLSSINTILSMQPALRHWMLEESINDTSPKYLVLSFIDLSSHIYSHNAGDKNKRKISNTPILLIYILKYMYQLTIHHQSI